MTEAQSMSTDNNRDPVAHFAQFIAEAMGFFPHLREHVAFTSEALAQHILRNLTVPSFQSAWASTHQGERELAYISRAQEQSKEGEIEVDDGALVSEGCDDGAYVQAWMWVRAADAGLDPLDSEGGSND
jgi:hypothetical protein